MNKRFPFLRYPLDWLDSMRSRFPGNARSKLSDHLAKARYPIRLLRYWWAGQALAEEARRLGRPLVVVDLGCERGWLKHFSKYPDSHYLTTLKNVGRLESHELAFWEVDSRLEIGIADYLLLRADGSDGSLEEYLSGAQR